MAWRIISRVKILATEFKIASFVLDTIGIFRDIHHLELRTSFYPFDMVLRHLWAQKTAVFSWFCHRIHSFLTQSSELPADSEPAAHHEESLA
jgi:hypothetical protein